MKTLQVYNEIYYESEKTPVPLNAGGAIQSFVRMLNFIS